MRAPWSALRHQRRPQSDRDLRRRARRHRQAVRDRLRDTRRARAPARSPRNRTRRACPAGPGSQGPDQRRERADGERPPHTLLRRPRNPLIHRAAPTGHPRQRRQWVHPDRNRLRARQRCRSLRRRRHQPLAVRLPRRRRAAIPPRARVRAGRVSSARGRHEGVPIREIAEIFAKHLDIPAVSVTAEQVGEYLGFLGGFWGFDGPASAQITRDLLGWEPTRPGLIADLEEGHYFT
jgi:hypothetical protein